MINIKQIDIGTMTLNEITELTNKSNLYIMSEDVDDGWRTEKFKLFTISNVMQSGKDYTVISIEKYSKEDLKNIPASDIEKVLSNIVEKGEDPYDDMIKVKKQPRAKFTTEMEPKIYNKACYAFLACNMTGSIHVVPKSNGAIRVNFDCKEQAEAYLKQFRRKLHYATNSVDVFTVANFYSMLGLVLSEEQKEISTMYGWQTVSTPEEMDKWLPRQANRSSDKEGWYGFTIAKRATRIGGEAING